MFNMKKWGKSMLTIMCLAGLGAQICTFQSFGFESGTWAIGKDGKRWSFYYTPEEPVKDEWIEYGGKEYYLDSSGYMATGWVTNKEDGNKYYMGEDGAKCFNIFTPDDRFVGPEGTVIERFDTYRKAFKRRIRSVMKSKEYKDLPIGQQPCFALPDLNLDGYRDLVIMVGETSSERLILAAIWDPEEEELEISAEADPIGNETFRFSFNVESQTAWMIIEDRSTGAADYFSIEETGFHFDNVYHFTVETDDWGEPDYYVNGENLSADEWNQAVASANADCGSRMELNILPLTEETMSQALDIVPTEEELDLWE